jgi:hypothetical protein
MRNLRMISCYFFNSIICDAINKYKDGRQFIIIQRHLTIKISESSEKRRLRSFTGEQLIQSNRRVDFMSLGAPLSFELSHHIKYSTDEKS